MKKKIIILVTSILVIAVCFEGFYLLIKYLKRGTIKEFNEYDDTLGWRPTPNFYRKTKLKDCLGRDYEVIYKSNFNGSRLWGTNPGKLKILFVGDSFTQAVEVSNDKAYYYNFAKDTGLDVYAFGSVGYGTLQEDLLLKEVVKVDNFSPDVFVLQFCNNDFINNSINLERDFFVYQQRIRPYLVNNKIVYDLKDNKIFIFFFKNSQLFRLLLNNFVAILYKIKNGYSYCSMDEETKKLYFSESVQTTDSILKQLKKDLPNTKLFYAFNLDEATEKRFLNNSFNEIMVKNGFKPLNGALDYINSGAKGSRGVKAADGTHLNEEGNLRLAEFLTDKICKDIKCN